MISQRRKIFIAIEIIFRAWLMIQSKFIWAVIKERIKMIWIIRKVKGEIIKNIKLKEIWLMSIVIIARNHTIMLDPICKLINK
jgi:hypothetical protein